MKQLEMQEKAMDLFGNAFIEARPFLRRAGKTWKKNDDLIKALAPFGGDWWSRGSLRRCHRRSCSHRIAFWAGQSREEADMKMWKYSREFLKRFGKEIVGATFSAATLFK